MFDDPPLKQSSHSAQPPREITSWPVIWWAVIALYPAMAIVAWGTGDVRWRVALFVLTLVHLRWSRHRVRQAHVPRKPRRPVPRSASFLVRPEPPRKSLILADECRVCGRSLSQLRSREAGVGTECIKVHGPRPQWGPNPEHGRWEEELIMARVAHGERQRAVDRENERALARYELDVQRFDAWMSSPEGKAAAAATRKRRRQSWLPLITGLGSMLIPF